MSIVKTVVTLGLAATMTPGRSIMVGEHALLPGLGDSQVSFAWKDYRQDGKT